MKKWSTYFAILSGISMYEKGKAEEFPKTNEDAAGFGQEKSSGDAERLGLEAGLSASEKTESERDRAEIGGRLRVEGVMTQTESQSLSKATMKSGSGAELYLDAKASEGVRALLRLRVEQMAKVVTSQGAASSSANNPNFSFDEAKIQGNIAKRIFVTAGRQKMKFGAARFFNPTDFPNDTQRDPFALDDRRPGVDAVKLHVPVSEANIYAIALPSTSGVVGETAGYGRIELGFGGGEVSLSGLARKGETSRGGADVSFALLDFDLYGELAVDKHRSYSAGFTWDIKVSDNDAITIGGEYHRNGDGFTDSKRYLPALMRGTHSPLALGRDYAAGSFYLSKPRWMRDSTFIFSAIENLSDGSRAVVPQIFHAATQDLTLSLRLLIPSGSTDGEFRLAKQRLQATVALEALL